MKTNDMHKNLEKSEIRDFLSESISECKFDILHNEESIKLLEKQLNEIQDRIYRSRKYIAAEKLIHSQGWELFDVSDDTEDWRETNMNFVGTRAEAKETFGTLINYDLEENTETQN